MTLFNRLIHLFTSFDDVAVAKGAAPCSVTINPASGQMMIGGMGGVDTSGNAYGFDNQSQDSSWSSFDHTSPFNDGGASISGSWDD